MQFFISFSSIFHQKSCLKKIQLLNFTNYIMIKENYTPRVTGRTALFQERQKVKEIDQNMVARMFDNLKAKIHSANKNGLSSLL